MPRVLPPEPVGGAWEDPLVSSPTGSHQRFWVRATLVAGMLLAVLGLVAVLGARERGAPGGGPALARTSNARPAHAAAGLAVRVVDPTGHVVRTARVFVETSGGAKPAEARWSPADGVLMLPRRARPHDLRVLARGFRVQDVAGVADDRTIVLERGYVLQVQVRDAPADGLPDHVGLMLRIRPLDAAPERGGRTTGARLDRATLIGLMDDVGTTRSHHSAEGEFGYPASLAQARRGLRLPRAGRYHVRWGLIDLPARTWYSLGAQCGRDVVVAPKDRSTQAYLTIQAEDVQATLEGLARRVAQAKAGK